MTGDVSKLAKLRAAWDAGDRLGALAIAARFPRLGDEREAISRGWAAHTNSDFYAQLGADVPALVDGALAAMARRYDLK